MSVAQGSWTLQHRLTGSICSVTHWDSFNHKTPQGNRVQIRVNRYHKLIKTIIICITSFLKHSVSTRRSWGCPLPSNEAILQVSFEDWKVRQRCGPLASAKSQCSDQSYKHVIMLAELTVQKQCCVTSFMCSHSVWPCTPTFFSPSGDVDSHYWTGMLIYESSYRPAEHRQQHREVVGVQEA